MLCNSGCSCGICGNGARRMRILLRRGLFEAVLKAEQSEVDSRYDNIQQTESQSENALSAVGCIGAQVKERINSRRL